MSEMLDLVLSEAREKTAKIQESLQRHFAKVRTGRASVSILDEIKADYYGVLTPIRHMANVTIPEPRLMVIQPFDPSSLKEIERAIQASDLGLNPLNDGKVIRLVIPELSEERRKDLVKHVRKLAEEHRVSARQLRRELNETLKTAEKDKEITEDELHHGLDLVQKEIDKAIANLDKLCEAKEKELMEV